MNNFTYSIPTTVFFGKDRWRTCRAPSKASTAKRVLMVYGGGSIKKMGL